jgi:hypothetical protein
MHRKSIMKCFHFTAQLTMPFVVLILIGRVVYLGLPDGILYFPNLGLPDGILYFPNLDKF